MVFTKEEIFKYFRDTRWFELGLIFVLILSYFRYPIFAFWGIKSLSKILIFFPFYFFIACLIFRKIQFTSLIRKKIFLLIIIGILYLSTVLVVDKFSTQQIFNSPTEFANNIYFFMLFPLILIICQADFKKLDKIIFYVALLVSLTGSLYLIAEYYLLKFQIFTVADVVGWLYSSDKLPNHNATNVGFIKKSSTSASTLGALYIFVFARFCFFKNLNSKLSLFVLGLYLALISWGLHISYSLTSSIMVLFFSSLVLVGWAFRKKKYFSATIFFAIQIIIFLHCRVSGKFVRYFIRNTLATIEDYKPVITGCKSSVFLTGVSVSSGCTMDEFHYFGTTLRLGLLADLSRLLITFAPLYLFRNFRTIRQYPDYAALFASFLFTLLHYGDLEVWPNIFIYIMALYVVSYKLLKAEQINATNLT